MQYRNEYRENCPCVGGEVNMAVSVEADGGADCFISWDRYEAECEKQENCPHRGEAQCLLVALKA